MTTATPPLPEVVAALVAESAQEEFIYEAAAATGAVTIVDLLDSLPWFRSASDWKAWRAFLCATYGLQMDREEYEIFRECTGRVVPPRRQVDEVWCICGRRARKSAIGGLMVAYHATYRDYRPYLAKGETARIPVLSKDIDEAGAIYNFFLAIMGDHPILRGQIVGNPTMERTLLRRQIEVKIKAATITGARSRAIPLAVLDELAFFPTKEAANPDTEILRAIRPGMANVPGAMLACFSSPHFETGELFEAFEQHYGKERDDILVWKAPTLRMHDNATVRAFVAKEYEKDPIGAEAEVGSNFRKDGLLFISREVVRACVVPGRLQVAPCSMDAVALGGVDPERYNYWAFVDTSGGSSDSFAIAVAHWDPKLGKAVLDAVKEWPAPFDTKETTKEAVEFVKPYHVTYVTGDAYGGQWPPDEFETHDLPYVQSQRSKHEIYRDLLPSLNSRRVELLDDPALERQLVDLRRKMTPTGQERIDHQPGQRDDRINAAGGALELAVRHGKHLDAPKVAQVAKDTEAMMAKLMAELEEEAQNVEHRGVDQWHDRWENGLC